MIYTKRRSYNLWKRTEWAQTSPIFYPNTGKDKWVSYVKEDTMERISIQNDESLKGMSYPQPYLIWL